MSSLSSCHRINTDSSESSSFTFLGALDVDAKALEAPDHRIGLRFFCWRVVHLRSYRPVFRYIP